MTDETHQIGEIFCAAVDIALRDQRERFVESACGENQELLSRVRSLLASHDRAEGFLESAAPGLPGLSQRIAAERSFDLVPGSTIDGYRIVKQIGEGGIGTVFLAEQSEPVRRDVALKVIKLGMDTAQVMQRFEAERQALALMGHPNIARVYDAGSTALGRPYFVMELVDGVAISEYCDTNRLDIRQRLLLFVQVCQAVHHAHQKGLIHRDIKPGNVLVSTVDDRPVAKVIDFGIAKATGVQARDKTLFTQSNKLIGTIEYMSPEQAEGSLDIDIRTDVYSLGVVLYELLTGRTPFEGTDLRSKAYGEMQRIIRETEPEKPSTRLSKLASLVDLARERGIDARQLNSAIKGELDWIVMKCIEKDRARRYESASSLAADILHFLADEPVSAAAPSRIYRARKFVRRNRGPVIASVAVLVVLVVGIIGTTIGFFGQARQRGIAERERTEARRQERQATEQAAIADAVSRFQADMIASADPEKLLGDKVTVVQAISAAVKELDAGKLRDQPLVEIAVRQMIGKTLDGLGRFDDAAANYRRALEIHRALGPDDAGTALTLNSLGANFFSRGDMAMADRTLREALATQRSARGVHKQDLVATLTNLGVVLEAIGKADEAEVFFREAHEINLRTGADERAIASSLANLASALLAQGKPEASEPLSREALARRRRCLPAGHPELLNALNNLAMALMHMQRYDEAIPLAREAVDGARKTYPKDHPLIATAVTSLGTIYLSGRRYADAEPLLREALQMQRRALPSGHLDIALSLNNLGTALRFQGKYADAEVAYREAFEIASTVLGADHPNVVSCASSLARVLKEQSKLAEAEQMYRGVLATETRTLPKDDAGIAFTEFTLAEVLLDMKRPVDAEPLLREAMQIYRKSLPSDDERVIDCKGVLAAVLSDRGNHAEADGLFREAVQAAAADPSKANLAAQTRLGHGINLTRLKRFGESETELLAAAGVLMQDPPDAGRGNVIEAVIALYEAWDQAQPGQGYAAKASQWRQKLTSPTSATSPATQPHEIPPPR